MKYLKWRYQERVPEFFEDTYDDPIYDPPPANDYDTTNDSDYDWSPDSGYRRCTCDDAYYSHCYQCDKSLNWDDWVSVDSEASDEIEHKESVEDETMYAAAAVIEKHSASSCANLNQYAVLEEEEEEEEETSLDMVEDNGVEEKEKVESFKEDILNEQMEDESDQWRVYHSKNVKKCIKVIENRIAVYEQGLADAQKWIDSCHDDITNTIGSVSKENEVIIIHTDGFFRRNRKAGYGVIVRNGSGVPIVASVNQGKPVSKLYHELQGISRGLELAIKYGLCNNVTVYCSSKRAACFVGSKFRCELDYYGSEGHSLDDICRRCAKMRDYDSSEEDFELFTYPLIREIVGISSMISFSIYEIKRGRNNVADYLAKLGLNKEERSPSDFPKELKDMLYKEAQSGVMMPGIHPGRSPYKYPMLTMW